jgi:hypothetical protein
VPRIITDGLAEFRASLSGEGHLVKRSVTLVALITAVALTPAACGPRETPEQQARARLAKAEAAMNECKRSFGLGDVPTPDTVILADPAQKGAELTPETAGQLRLKVQCRLELDELLDARRAVPR